MRKTWASYAATGMFFCNGQPYSRASVGFYACPTGPHNCVPLSSGKVKSNGLFFVKYAINHRRPDMIHPYLFIKHKCKRQNEKWSWWDMSPNWKNNAQNPTKVRQFGNVELSTLQ